jgi:signal transduction histidine kinase
VEPSVQLPDAMLANDLYRIAQDALQNAVKHGQPRHIEVRLEKELGYLVLSVRDDSSGITNAESSGGGGLGIHFMRYRAGIIGGQLSIGTPA